MNAFKLPSRKFLTSLLPYQETFVMVQYSAIRSSIIHLLIQTQTVSQVLWPHEELLLNPALDGTWWAFSEENQDGVWAS
jgi:hypothetical protein